MAHLIPCPACKSHVLLEEDQCPHCGAAIRTTTARNAAVVLMGLALAGCPPPAEALYGVADTSDPPPTTSATTGDTDTDESTGGSGSGSASGSGGSGSSGTTMGDSGSGTTGSTGSGSDGATGSSSLGEPEYGVPETESG